MHTADVIVIGGGNIGSAVTCGMSEQNVSVTVMK